MARRLKVPEQVEGNIRGYLYVVERNLELNNWKWRQRWATVPMDKMPEPSTPATQEDAVYLKEVIGALLARPRRGTRKSEVPQLVKRFLEDCDGTRGVGGERTGIGNAASQHIATTRRWLRAWREENA